MTTPRVGDRVRIERDETRRPCTGTWPQFRGRAGTVVEINHDRKRAHLTQSGVVFGATRRRPDGSLTGNGVTWFKRWEMRALAAESHAERGGATRPVEGHPPSEDPRFSSDDGDARMTSDSTKARVGGDLGRRMSLRPPPSRGTLVMSLKPDPDSAWGGGGAGGISAEQDMILHLADVVGGAAGGACPAATR